MFWLSGYGPTWLQNATLLEQLGPRVSTLGDLQGREERLGASLRTKPRARAFSEFQRQPHPLELFSLLPTPHPHLT